MKFSSFIGVDWLEWLTWVRVLRFPPFFPLPKYVHMQPVTMLFAPIDTQILHKAMFSGNRRLVVVEGLFLRRQFRNGGEGGGPLWSKVVTHPPTFIHSLPNYFWPLWSKVVPRQLQHSYSYSLTNYFDRSRWSPAWTFTFMGVLISFVFHSSSLPMKGQSKSNRQKSKSKGQTSKSRTIKYLFFSLQTW